MPKIVNINMNEMAVGHSGMHIRTGSVGSCVVIVLYDGIAKVGGMAHAMLPSRIQQEDFFEAREWPHELPAKYASEAVDRLMEAILKIGGEKHRIEAKLVGGAKMFQVLGGGPDAIGYQNIAAAKKRLEELGIQIKSQDIGGTVGKNVELSLENGLVEVSTKI